MVLVSHQKGPEPMLRSSIPVLGYAHKDSGPERNHRMSALVERLRRTLLAPPDNAERLHALFLTSGRTLLGESRLAIGTSEALSLRLRDLFRRALALDASAIILAHNHPSGDCRPSESDLEATRCIAGLARALDIELLDHLIFTHRAVYSMRARGEL